MISSMEARYAAYDHVCRVYEDYLASLSLACQKGCATCCTINVTLTALEAGRIVRYIDTTGQTGLYERLRSVAGQKRYHPQLSLNQMADIYRQGGDVPEEEIDPAWGTCPLLTDDKCPIYAVRPFACRCLVSEAICRQTGFAQTGSTTITVNYIMQQYIEHIDAHGFTGNLVDMLLHMESTANRERYETADLPGILPANCISHAPARVLLVPPEEKNAIAPLLTALNAGDDSPGD